MADVRHITLDGVQLDIPIPGVMTGAGASAAGSAGLVPAPASGQQERFLKGDGTWAEVVTEIDPMTGATSSTSGEEGLVPAPAAGDQNKVLKGDGTWGDPSVMTGATAIANGAKGLAPAPAAGDQNKVLKGDGTWGDPSVMTGATAITNGEKGLVPAPVAGETNRFLRADGSWTVPAGSGDSQVGIYTVNATIPTSAWTANNGVYTVTISDQTVTSTMTVLEWGITNEDDDAPVMLGETDVTTGAGVITITTDAMPSASWTMHIDLGTDGANVLAEVAGKADQELLGYKEDGNTASRAIADGMFVVWKGGLYTANGPIAQGATFSSSNLTAVTNGGLNEIKSDVSTLGSDLDALEGSVSTLSSDLDTLEGNVGTLSSNVSAFSGKAIANNLTTTSEGYVLDARQGKALNDSVTSLNDSIATKASITSDYSFSGTPSADGLVVSNLPLSSGYYPIAVKNPSRQGWVYSFARYDTLSSSYWCVDIRGANASSGTFSGTIVAVG